MKIIDAHLHFAPGSYFNEVARAAGHENSAAHLEKCYAELGIERGIVMSNLTLDPEELIYPELLPHPNKIGTFRSLDWGNWSKLIKRSIVSDNHIRYYSKSRRCEDLCFAFECTIHSKSYYVMEPEPLYHYTPSETSKSRHYTNSMWRSISMLMHYLMELGENYKEYDFSENIQYCILYFCTIVIRNETFGPEDKEQMQRIQEILDDPLCRDSLYLSNRNIYNKEYTAVFEAMRSGKARKVYKTLKWFAWKKKYAAPILSRIKR